MLASQSRRAQLKAGGYCTARAVTRARVEKKNTIRIRSGVPLGCLTEPVFYIIPAVYKTLFVSAIRVDR